MNCERLRKTETRHVGIHNYLRWFRPRTLLDAQNLHDEKMVVVSVICHERGVLSAFSRDVQRGLAHGRLCTHPRARDVRAALWAGPDMFSICVKAEVVKWQKT